MTGTATFGSDSGSPTLMTETSPADVSQTASELMAAIGKFSAWLDRAGLSSYDPYDFWGTRYGKLARRLYYQKKLAGAAMTAPFIALEILYPRFRKWGVGKERFPSADAQVGLAYLNLYRASQAWGSQAAESWRLKAETVAEEALNRSVPGYSGYCWGYPFDWQNVNGLMRKGTPHIIATPYCYELFTQLFDLTGEPRYLRVAESIAAFAFKDLNDTPWGEDAAASSYTPFDRGKVVNASAYRAFLLCDAARRFGNPQFFEKAWKNVRFILQSQRDDGAWLYAIDNKAEAFIDHFHTCFVLKNLFKLNQDARSSEVSDAIRRGYQWYRKFLFDEHDNPRSYAIAPRVQIVKLEMYNFAEAITLGVLLRNEIPEAFRLAEKLALRLTRQYQVAAGHFVTRVYLGEIRHTVPFLRWPQSQLFLALTNLLVASQAGSATP